MLRETGGCCGMLWDTFGKCGIQQSYQGGAAYDLTLVDKFFDFAQRNPFDSFGFGSIGWWAEVFGGICAKEVMHGIYRPIGRLRGDDRAERARTPAGFLLDFAGRRLLRCL